MNVVKRKGTKRDHVTLKFFMKLKKINKFFYFITVARLQATASTLKIIAPLTKKKVSLYSGFINLRDFRCKLVFAFPGNKRSQRNFQQSIISDKFEEAPAQQEFEN